MKKQRKRLSEGDLELLDVLWQSSGLTIRQVQEKINREVGYTTIQTRLNRLVDKGHAKKTKDRPGLYIAVLKKERVSKDDLNSLVNRVTKGNVVPLIAHLVKQRDLSDTELNEIRQLIDTAEQSRDSKGDK